MTHRLVRSLPISRPHQRAGVSFVSARVFARPEFRRPLAHGFRPAHERPRLLLVGRSADQPDRLPRDPSENRRLNAHVSSAVPFNSLFPHS